MRDRERVRMRDTCREGEDGEEGRGMRDRERERENFNNYYVTIIHTVHL